MHPVVIMFISIVFSIYNTEMHINMYRFGLYRFTNPTHWLCVGNLPFLNRLEHWVVLRLPLLLHCRSYHVKIKWDFLLIIILGMRSNIVKQIKSNQNEYTANKIGETTTTTDPATATPNETLQRWNSNNNNNKMWHIFWRAVSV